MARIQYFIRDVSGEGVGRLDSVYFLFEFDGATVSDSHTDELRTKLTEALGEPIKESMPHNAFWEYILRQDLNSISKATISNRH